MHAFSRVSPLFPADMDFRTDRRHLSIWAGLLQGQRPHRPRRRRRPRRPRRRNLRHRPAAPAGSSSSPAPLPLVRARAVALGCLWRCVGPGWAVYRNGCVLLTVRLFPLGWGIAGAMNTHTHHENIQSSSVYPDASRPTVVGRLFGCYSFRGRGRPRTGTGNRNVFCCAWGIWGFHGAYLGAIAGAARSGFVVFFVGCVSDSGYTHRRGPVVVVFAFRTSWCRGVDRCFANRSATMSPPASFWCRRRLLGI